MKDCIIFYQEASESFGARLPGQMLPYGCVPVAIMINDKIIWEISAVIENTERFSQVPKGGLDAALVDLFTNPVKHYPGWNFNPSKGRIDKPYAFPAKKQKKAKVKS